MLSHYFRGVLVTCFVGCWMLSAASEVSASAGIQLPLKKIAFQVSGDSRQVFLDAVRQYADINEFAVRIAVNTPNGDRFTVQLWRTDIKIIGNNSLDPEEFRFGIYTVQPEVIDVALLEEVSRSFSQVGKCIDGVSLVQQN
jgi:hypothetical protein